MPASLLMVGVAGLALSLTGCTPMDTAGAIATQPKQAFAPALAAINPVQPAQAAGQVRPAPTPPPPTPEEQHVRVLITQVEEAYSRGSADYQKGMLAEAKEEFDRAVDLMLSSGIDIKSNAELQDEFDKIVDQVNALEMDALKQGNGFVPKEEITPSEAASDITFASDPNLVAKATADLATTKSDLPLVVNDYVATYINFFANTQKGHNTLLHSFERSGHYKAMIQRVLAEEGVPQDLIYQAVAESGFNPRAIGPRTRSGGRAGGMWQFMPHDTYYGLAFSAYVDERFDPEKSTRAYARYMKFLYNQLGDWYLAMAAYDWGAGRVQQAVEKTGYADFWELYKRGELPKETANYVPEILAAIIIANHPTQYGFDDITLDPPVLTDTVTVNYPIDLRLVSDLVGAPVDELEALNPSLLRMVTPPEASFDLHLPAGTATLFDQRVALIPEARRNSWRYHPVVAGDTLASVAEEYRVTAGALAEANQLTPGDSIAGVEALAVPVAPSAEPSSRTRMYTVRRGDTLVTIADRFGVSLSQLRSWNAIPAGTRVAPGRRLRVAEPAPVEASSRHRRGTAGEGTKAGDGSRMEPKPGPAPRAGTPRSRAGEAASPAPEKGRPRGTGGGSLGARKSAANESGHGSGHKPAHRPTHRSSGVAKASQ